MLFNHVLHSTVFSLCVMNGKRKVDCDLLYFDTVLLLFYIVHSCTLFFLPVFVSCKLGRPLSTSRFNIVAMYINEEIERVSPLSDMQNKILHKLKLPQSEYVIS